MSADEKSKAEESKVADELDAEMNEREAERLKGEQDEQQDVNQGMDTGTHSSTKSGVDWGPSYRNLSKPAKPAAVPKDEKSDSE